MVHKGNKPPKLILPTSTSMKWNRFFLVGAALIFLVLVGPAILYRLGYKPAGVAPVAPIAGNTTEDSPRQLSASDVSKVVAGGEPTNDPKKVSTTKGGTISLTHDGAIITTAFDDGWDLKVNGAQALISNDRKGAVCQSLLLPMAEYSAMMQSVNGDHLEVVRALLSLQVEMLASKGVKATVTAETLFEEKTPVERIGLVGQVLVPAASQSIPTYLVYAVKPPHVASLQCSTVRPPLDPIEALGWLKGYDFKN